MGSAAPHSSPPAPSLPVPRPASPRAGGQQGSSRATATKAVRKEPWEARKKSPRRRANRGQPRPDRRAPSSTPGTQGPVASHPKPNPSGLGPWLLETLKQEPQMGLCCILLFFFAFFFLKPAFFSQFLRLLPACHAHPVPPRVPLPRPLGLCSPLGTDAEDQSPPVKPVRVVFFTGRVSGLRLLPRHTEGTRRHQEGAAGPGVHGGCVLG